MKGVTNGSSVAMAPSPIVTGRGEKGMSIRRFVRI